MRIALAALLLGLAINGAAQAAETCQLKQVASIPVSIGASGRILMDVSINDHPVKLLLDTGASFSLLDRGFAQQAGLSLTETGTIGYGLTGHGINQATRVDRLQLGNAVSRGSDFAVGDTSAGGSGAVGLFGADYLYNYDVEFDLAANRVKLYSQDHCPGQVVYWAKEYFRLPLSFTRYGKRIDADIQVEGKPLRALIDTGASGIAMRLAVARRLFDIDPEAEGLRHRKSTGIDGSVDTFSHVFDSLTFGDITLRNTTIAIADIDMGKGRSNPGSHMSGAVEQEDILIGMPLLRKLHFFIAYSEPALYFTLAEPPKAP
jgi:predicted aspartyl protease